MRILLFIMAIIAAGMGFLTEAFAKAVTHEILGGVFFIIAAVLFSGAAIVDAITQLPARMGRGIGQAQDSPVPREAVITERDLDALIESGGRQRR